jgi:hypothetical protein
METHEERIRSVKSFHQHANVLLPKAYKAIIHTRFCPHYFSANFRQKQTFAHNLGTRRRDIMSSNISTFSGSSSYRASEYSKSNSTTTGGSGASTFYGLTPRGSGAQAYEAEEKKKREAERYREWERLVSAEQEKNRGRPRRRYGE